MFAEVPEVVFIIWLVINMLAGRRETCEMELAPFTVVEFTQAAVMHGCVEIRFNAGIEAEVKSGREHTRKYLLYDVFRRFFIMEEAVGVIAERSVIFPEQFIESLLVPFFPGYYQPLIIFA